MWTLCVLTRVISSLHCLCDSALPVTCSLRCWAQMGPPEHAHKTGNAGWLWTPLIPSQRWTFSHNSLFFFPFILLSFSSPVLASFCLHFTLVSQKVAGQPGVTIKIDGGEPLHFFPPFPSHFFVGTFWANNGVQTTSCAWSSAAKCHPGSRAEPQRCLEGPLSFCPILDVHTPWNVKPGHGAQLFFSFLKSTS